MAHMKHVKMNGVGRFYDSEKVYAEMNAVIVGRDNLTVNGANNMNQTCKGSANCIFDLGMNATVFAGPYSEIECGMNSVLYGEHGSTFKSGENSTFIYKCKSGKVVAETTQKLKPYVWYKYDEYNDRWMRSNHKFVNSKRF